MENFKGSKLKKDIVIDKIFTVHYFEYSTTYRFIGESHDFWEIVYADKGEATVFAQDRSFTLKQGEMVFHKPNEWHNIHSDGNAPNIVIITFECKSETMKFFENKVLTVSQVQKSIISKIINEYTSAFKTPLNDPFTNKLARKKESLVGAEQLLGQYLCELLILFLRNNSASQRSMVYINNSNLMLNKLLFYMQEHIKESITISHLISCSGSNKTTITQLFKTSFDKGPIEYFIFLKIQEAKRLLREDNLNVTQISDMLGYSSIHYFSRQFKTVEGMSPVEYSRSVKALLKDVPLYSVRI